MAISIKENHEKLEKLDSKEFICEPAYCTARYGSSHGITLRTGAIQNLRKAQEKLKKHGNYRLKIFDGFRPITLQEEMYNQAYEIFKKENPNFPKDKIKKLTEKYWSFPDKNPLSPPPHNTGGAVDLTVVDAEYQEVQMGTNFDELIEKSSTEYYEKNGKNEKNASKYHANRMLLRSVMEEAGFKNYPDEWWHFDYGNQEWAKVKGEITAIYGSAEIVGYDDKKSPTLEKNGWELATRPSENFEILELGDLVKIVIVRVDPDELDDPIRSVTQHPIWVSIQQKKPNGWSGIIKTIPEHTLKLKDGTIFALNSWISCTTKNIFAVRKKKHKKQHVDISDSVRFE